MAIGDAMTSVTKFEHSIDRKVWAWTERVAYDYPNASRLLAIPISIGGFLKDSLSPPARFIEEAIRTGVSIRKYIGEEDEKLKAEQSNAIQNHVFNAVTHLIATPFTPLLAAIKAIIIFVKMILFPYYVAKTVNAALDLTDLYNKKKFKNESECINGELIHFANETLFAESALNRFKDKTKSITNAEIHELHFLDTKEAEKELLNEIELKKNIFQRFSKIYLEKRKEQLALLQAQTIDQETHGKKEAKLTKAWIKFQNKLIKADGVRANTLVFNPA